MTPFLASIEFLRFHQTQSRGPTDPSLPPRIHLVRKSARLGLSDDELDRFAPRLPTGRKAARTYAPNHVALVMLQLRLLELDAGREGELVVDLHDGHWNRAPRYTRRLDWCGPALRDTLAGLVDLELLECRQKGQPTGPTSRAPRQRSTYVLTQAGRAAADQLIELGQVELANLRPGVVLQLGARPKRKQGERRKKPRSLEKLPFNAATQRALQNLANLNATIHASTFELEPEPNRDGTPGDHDRRRPRGQEDRARGHKVAKERCSTNEQGHLRLILPSCYFEHDRRFFDGRQDRYGRFHFPAQSLPGDVRRRLRVNGEPICETDFGSAHPRIAYGLNRVPAPDDAYAVPGFRSEERPCLKVALNILFNTKSRRGAIRALQRHHDDFVEAEDRGIAPPRKAFKLPEGRTAAEIIDSLREYHAPISNFFSKCGGLRLMAVEAEIAAGVADDFAALGRKLGRPVPLLIYHDGFAAPASAGEFLLKSMERNWNKVLGASAVIKKVTWPDATGPLITSLIELRA